MAVRLPYPGLRPFRREESDLFFGREGCTNDMVDRLAATRFLAVLGASGSGKSSLVMTGLLDALVIGLHARAGSRWRIAYMRPGSRPTENLARALLNSEETGKQANDLDIELLASYLQRGPRSLVEWCIAGNLAPGTNLLVLVDQFEELFRVAREASCEESQLFVDLIATLLKADSASPVRVIRTIRSKFLGECAGLPSLAGVVITAQYLLPRMETTSLLRPMRRPAEIYGSDVSSP